MKRHAPWVALFLCLSAGAVAKPQAVPAFGAAFALRGGQSVRIESLSVGLTVVRHPFERDARGRELYPSTEYTLTWHEGDETATNEHVTPFAKGRQTVPHRLFGRYTFLVERGASDDEVSITLAKRSCLFSYTSSNQLQHPSGEIIFTEREDLCCAWSDGLNRCDVGVTRARGAGSSPRYCTVYSLQHGPQVGACCCRFERGETLDPACAAECAPMAPGARKSR